MVMSLTVSSTNGLGPSALYSKTPAIDPFPSQSSFSQSFMPSYSSPSSLSVLDTAALMPVLPRFPERQEYTIVVPASFFSKTEKRDSPEISPRKEEPFPIEFPQWFDFVL